MITVELRGLRVFGYHGVNPSERAKGQDFLFDVDLVVGDRGESDKIEDAADYREVARTVQELSDEHTYELLEALATAIADELLERFRAERAVVRVTKPAVRPAGLDGAAGVSVSRP
ncbi:MAG TPA: dihydroneopterin aldolase [Gaiellaceae bacterium]|nr:dihydroneopterin aldolase [Gaiellaceae bacterium]